MSTVLYYFTGTGNSLKLAQDLARELGNAELIPIARVIGQTKIAVAADRIGIIFPVYIWGLPLIVTRFVKKLALQPAAYIFGVTTYGGFPAATLVQLQKQLAERGLKLAAGFGVRMPGNYTPLYGAIPEHAQQKMFGEAQQKIKEIAKSVRSGLTGRIDRNNFLINFLFSTVLYELGIPQLHQADAKFWVNEKCTRCGDCLKVCPVNNIRLVDGKPQWQHLCEQCLACLQWCPAEAIQYGKATLKRKRYRHPEISLKDIAAQK